MTVLVKTDNISITKTAAWVPERNYADYCSYRGQDASLTGQYMCMSKRGIVNLDDLKIGESGIALYNMGNASAGFTTFKRHACAHNVDSLIVPYTYSVGVKASKATNHDYDDDYMRLVCQVFAEEFNPPLSTSFYGARWLQHEPFDLAFDDGSVHDLEFDDGKSYFMVADALREHIFGNMPIEEGIKLVAL